MASLPEAILKALEQRDLESAEALACTHIEENPSAGEVWAILAVLSAQRGDIPEALERNEKALDAQPENAGTWVNQGNLLKLADRIDEAREAYGTALRCDPKQADAAFNLGVLSGEDSNSSEAESHYRDALQMDSTHAGSLYNLARELSHRDDSRSTHATEVVRLYRAALTQNPIWPDAWRNLGNFLRGLGRDEEAASAYEELLRIQPGDETTSHLLAALRRESPASANPAYVTQLFDRFAESYDRELATGLHYEGASRLAEIVRPHLQNQTPRLLDLGCGTGLFLEALALKGAVATGVDLSSEMLGKARDKGLYQNFETSEIGAYLVSGPLEFDLIVAADVFVYLGDLASVFEQIAGALLPEGLFVFTVESWPEADPDDTFELQRSGRYRHSVSYLEGLATEAQLKVVVWERAPLRREKTETLSGEYVVLQLKSGRSKPK